MKIALLVLLKSTNGQAQSKTFKNEKESLISKYKEKTVTAKKDGLSMGFCTGMRMEGYGGGEYGHLVYGVVNYIEVVGNQVTPKNVLGCGIQPVQKGELLSVDKVVLFRGFLELRVSNLSQHSITRGIGENVHQSIEYGKAVLAFRAGSDGKDLAAADVLAGLWLQLPSSSHEDNLQKFAVSPKIGNTDSGVFVNQIKLGMSFAEVESALGVPQTRVDLGEKVLYKYKDMTVEFLGGKVADVR